MSAYEDTIRNTATKDGALVRRAGRQQVVHAPRRLRRGDRDARRARPRVPAGRQGEDGKSWRRRAGCCSARSERCRRAAHVVRLAACALAGPAAGVAGARCSRPPDGCRVPPRMAGGGPGRRASPSPRTRSRSRWRTRASPACRPRSASTATSSAASATPSFGSSRQLAVGPTSAISLMVGVTLAQIAGGDAARYAADRHPDGAAGGGPQRARLDAAAEHADELHQRDDPRRVQGGRGAEHRGHAAAGALRGAGRRRRVLHRVWHRSAASSGI